MSKLTREECTSLFKQMADCRELALRQKELYRVLGQGVWLMHGSTGDQLKVMKPSMAIYVPMASIPMFFLSQSLLDEKVDPMKEMLLALHYGIGGQGAYLWAKVTVSTTPPKQPTPMVLRAMPLAPQPRMATQVPVAPIPTRARPVSVRPPPVGASRIRPPATTRILPVMRNNK